MPKQVPAIHAKRLPDQLDLIDEALDSPILGVDRPQPRWSNSMTS